QSALEALPASTAPFRNKPPAETSSAWVARNSSAVANSATRRMAPMIVGLPTADSPACDREHTHIAGGARQGCAQKIPAWLDSTDSGDMHIDIDGISISRPAIPMTGDEPRAGPSRGEVRAPPIGVVAGRLIHTFGIVLGRASL